MFNQVHTHNISVRLHFSQFMLKRIFNSFFLITTNPFFRRKRREFILTKSSHHFWFHDYCFSQIPLDLLAHQRLSETWNFPRLSYLLCLVVRGPLRSFDLVPVGVGAGGVGLTCEMVGSGAGGVAGEGHLAELTPEWSHSGLSNTT